LIYTAPIAVKPKITIGPRKGPNATNKLFSIYLADDLGRQILPILEQEYAENRRKALQSVLSKVRSIREGNEIFGHEVEVQAAFAENDDDKHERRMSEARALTSDNSSYHRRGMFRKATVQEVYDRMKKQEGKALKWHRKNVGKVNKMLLDAGYSPL